MSAARRRRAAAALAALLLASPGCAAERAPRPPPRGEASAPRAPAAAAVRASSEAVAVDWASEGPGRVLAALRVRADHPLWGGLSGLALDADGAGFVVVSDRGMLFEGRVARGPSGAAESVLELTARPLIGPDGLARPARRDDPEALARGPDGALLAAFEQDPRVWRWPRTGAAAERLPVAPGWAALPANTGLEALAAAADGALVAIAEHPGAAGGFPLWRLDPGGEAWREGVWPGDPQYRPTGADFGPDGLLYVVERAVTLFGGFRVRVRRARLDGIEAAAPETLVALRGPGVDNFEAIGVWRDGAGALRALLASDDNFSPLQRTLFVDLALPDAAPR